jgi:lipopolysaccharide export system protein LptA
MTNLFGQKKSLSYCSRASLLITLILLGLQKNALAVNTDEEVFISADYMSFNIESGNSVYTGNVKITQGKLLLTGDKITVKQENNILKRVTVIGKPARYNHITEDGEPVSAQSEQMDYNASQNKLILTINAILEQPDHRVSSQTIIYDTKKRIIIAGDPNKPEGLNANTDTNRQRVNITLTPAKKSPTKE